MSEANCQARLTYSKQLLKKYSPSGISIIFVTHKKIFTMATCTEKSQNDRLYALASIKKKDVVIKRLRTRLIFSHGWHQSTSHKWLTVHQFDKFANHGLKVNEAYFGKVMLL